MVHLELDRKTLFLSLVGLCVAGVLVFVAGMVVAIHWYLPAYAGTTSGDAPEAPAQEETVTRAMQPPAVSSSSTGAPRPRSIRLPRAPQPRAPRLRVPASPRVAAPVARAEAPSPAEEPAPPAIPVYDDETALYSVQVGAFASEFNMQNLMLELQDRGYQPYVVTIAINRQILHTVRIGEYATREEAAGAAATFFEREGMAAVVREVVSSLG